MSNLDRMVVADRYKLRRDGGKFNQEGRVIYRKGMKVLTSYIEEVNAQSELHGHYYEIDEEATERIKEKQIENREIRKAQQTVNSTTAGDLIKALGVLNQPTTNAEKPEKTKQIAPESVDENSTREEIIAYLKANKIKFNPANATEKLLIIALEGGNNA